jgi:hypothetical protein
LHCIAHCAQMQPHPLADLPQSHHSITPQQITRHISRLRIPHQRIVVHRIAARGNPHLRNLRVNRSRRFPRSPTVPLADSERLEKSIRLGDGRGMRSLHNGCLYGHEKITPSRLCRRQCSGLQLSAESRKKVRCNF